MIDGEIGRLESCRSAEIQVGSRRFEGIVFDRFRLDYQQRVSIGAYQPRADSPFPFPLSSAVKGRRFDGDLSTSSAFSFASFILRYSSNQSTHSTSFFPLPPTASGPRSPSTSSTNRSPSSPKLGIGLRET